MSNVSTLFSMPFSRLSKWIVPSLSFLAFRSIIGCFRMEGKCDEICAKSITFRRRRMKRRRRGIFPPPFTGLFPSCRLTRRGIAGTLALRDSRGGVKVSTGGIPIFRGARESNSSSNSMDLVKIQSRRLQSGWKRMKRRNKMAPALSMYFAAFLLSAPPGDPPVSPDLFLCLDPSASPRYPVCFFIRREKNEREFA